MLQHVSYDILHVLDRMISPGIYRNNGWGRRVDLRVSLLVFLKYLCLVEVQTSLCTVELWKV